LLIQPLYLYFDFSGYTDIAIGFAKGFGIDLLPNFNRPFFSENMTTFWKRFHISLSSWFNDYVFRQTSFKYRRWGISASVFALLVTWTLFGIWHGAGWSFMILGLVQALAIIYEFFTKKWRVLLFSKLPDFPRIWFGRIVTYLFYGGSLVFFFAPDMNSAVSFFPKLFNFSHEIGSIREVLHNVHREISYSAVIFIAIFILVELIKNDFNEIFNKIESFWKGVTIVNKLSRWVVYYLMIAIIYVFGGMIQQFIYFQF
jgi:alginate O-acetyltransferase complex protein AlgI